MPLPLVHYLYPSAVSKFLYQNERGDTSWALVTGASDGIGLALCHELATHGFNVVLHSRNEAKLKRCREELEAAHRQRNFRIVAVDASNFGSADMARIVATVSDIHLTMVVNNVGGTATLHTNFMPFEDTSPEEMIALYSMNVQFPLQLTNALLPQLHALKQPALVMTCGSMSNVGQPWIAAYSSTKGALHAWNRALAAEQYDAGSQIEVLEVIVGATYTQQLEKDPNFSRGLFMPDAETMAQSILARVGHGHRSVVPYFWHMVQTGPLYTLLPNWVVDSLIAKIIGKSVERKTK